MLRLILREMPGTSAGRYRFSFSERPGEPSVNYEFTGDMDALRAFLKDKLDLPPHRIAGALAGVVAGQTVGVEIDYDLKEIRDSVRQWSKPVEKAADGTVRDQEHVTAT